MVNALKSLNYYKNKLLVTGLLLIIASLLVEQTERESLQLILTVLAFLTFLGSYTGHIVNKTLQSKTSLDNKKF